MTRRGFLATGSAALAQQSGARSQFGVATTCFLSYRRPKDTLEFIDYVHGLGASGVQAPLTSLEPEYVARVKKRVAELGLFFEVMCALPGVDMARFVRTVEAAKDCGALCVRAACLGGRRYETFSTVEEWEKFVGTSHDAVARAVPVVEKLKLALALENHKDWTVEEMVALLKKYSSEYLGVCLDTGNNIALLDDPWEVVEELAPFAVSTHIKDMGVAPAADGFLLSEVVLGAGFLDVGRMMNTIAAARPRTKFTLEMITRDPLRVPALTEKYWVTFTGRNGKYLARTLRMVGERKSELPRFSQLSREAQLAAEEENVRRCLRTPLKNGR